MRRARERTSGGVRERYCPRCQSWIALQLFISDRKGAGGYGNQCTACRRKRRKAAEQRKRAQRRPLVSVAELHAFVERFCRFDEEHACTVKSLLDVATSVEPEAFDALAAQQLELALADARRALEHARCVAEGRATSAIGPDTPRVPEPIPEAAPPPPTRRAPDNVIPFPGARQ